MDSITRAGLSCGEAFETVISNLVCFRSYVPAPKYKI